MLTCMKPRLLRLQKSTNDNTWGVGVQLGTAGPGLTCYGCNPNTGIDMTTTSENRGRQIQTTEIS